MGKASGEESRFLDVQVGEARTCMPWKKALSYQKRGVLSM